MRTTRRLHPGDNPPDPSGDILLKFSIDSGTPNIAMADFKYDKDVAMAVGFDDGLINQYKHMFPLFVGGVSALNGATYPGLKYSDGTGRLIHFNATLVIPAGGVALIDNQDGANSLSWTKVKTMVDAGFGINNHSLNHGGGPNPWNRLNEIKAAEQLFFDKAGYRPLIGTTPAAEDGFMFSFKNLGYIAHNSTYNEGRSDLTIYGKMRPNDVPTDYRSLDRAYFGDDFTQSEINGMKAYIDEIYTYCDGGQKGFGNFFTHGPGDAARFAEVYTYLLTHPKNTDQSRLWVPSVQEFFEYFISKRNSVIESSVANGILTIAINQEDIPNNIRDRSLSLKISGVNISALISSQGTNDVTFNTETGLVNIYKKSTSQVTNPSADILPAQITNVILQSDTTKVKVYFDIPVTQSLLAGYSLSDGKQLSSLSGSGKVWTIAAYSAISTANTFSYKSSLGNAVSEGRPKVCDYIAMPIQAVGTTPPDAGSGNSFDENLSAREAEASSVWYANTTIKHGTTNTPAGLGDSVGLIKDKLSKYPNRDMVFVGPFNPTAIKEAPYNIDIIGRPNYLIDMVNNLKGLLFVNSPNQAYTTPDYAYVRYPIAFLDVILIPEGQNSEALRNDYGGRGYISELNNNWRLSQSQAVPPGSNNFVQVWIEGASFPKTKRFKRLLHTTIYDVDTISVYDNGVLVGTTPNIIPMYADNDNSVGYGDRAKLRSTLGVTTNCMDGIWMATSEWYNNEFTYLKNNFAAVQTELMQKFGITNDYENRPHCKDLVTSYNPTTQQYSVSFTPVNATQQDLDNTTYDWVVRRRYLYRNPDVTGQGNFTPQRPVGTTAILPRSAIESLINDVGANGPDIIWINCRVRIGGYVSGWIDVPSPYITAGIST